MNGVGTGGGTYMSEDDFEDYKPSASQLQSSTSAYYNTGSSVSSVLGSTGGSGLAGANVSGGAAHSTTFTGSGLGANSSSGGGSQGSSSSRNQNCCLLDDGKRCSRFAGNASYSKRIHKTVHYKRLKLDVDSEANHIYICDHHKMVIQNARTRQSKRDTDDETNDGDDAPEVDLYQLQVNTLRRYKKHFKIPTRPGLNKAQLADILMRHFKTIPVQEKETITYFIYMIKSEKSKLDNNNRPEGGGGAGSGEYNDRY